MKITKSKHVMGITGMQSVRKGVKRRMAVLCLATCIVLFAQILSGCAQNAPKPQETPAPSANAPANAPSNEPSNAPAMPNDEAAQTPDAIPATITMENGGIISLELYPTIAPQSVYNFVSLVRAGFYDGLKFHRIMSGFMIQGGDPTSTGTGGPGYSIKGEFEQNGFQNPLKHTRGVLSMARANAPDTAGSQFFIMHADNPPLDGAYAAFGKVVSGMEVVDEIAKTPNSGPNGEVADADMPVMKSITIDSDVELPEPERR